MGYLAPLQDGSEIRVSKYALDEGAVYLVDSAGHLYDVHTGGGYIYRIGRDAVGGASAYDATGDPSAGGSSSGLAQFPVVSRRLPFAASSGGGFGGNLAESNAIDGDYATTWSSVTSPNGGTAQWFALDLRSVDPADKADLWFVWHGGRGHYFEKTAALGSDAASVFINCPRNYKLQGHASSGSLPAVGDAGWTDIVSVTDNRYNSRVHEGIDLSGYNWFRIYVTAANGVTGATDGVTVQFELRDASASSDDSIFFYGDSITWEGMFGIRPDNQPWGAIGPIQNAIQNLCGRTAPVVFNGGVVGWMASDGDTNKADYIDSTPCKYVALCFGANDANAANIDLTGQGGKTSAYALAYKASMQSMIDHCEAAGKLVVLPKITDGSADAWSNANVQILNSIIDDLLAENPTAVAGPDLYPLFHAHANLLADALHPTYDNSVSAGTYLGLTGFEHWQKLWAEALIANLYS